MCQSKANGGKRCDNASAFAASRTRLTARLRRHEKAGNDAAAQADQHNLDQLQAAEEKYGTCVSQLDLDVPIEVEGTFTALRNAGYTPLIVGGSVRDAIDGHLPKDIDIEVYGASIDEVSRALRRSGHRVDEVGKSFGVLKTVVGDGIDLDISVPRRDNNVGAGHRGFTVETDANMSVEEASSRRDFTVNAIGYDPQYGVAVDPHGGIQDLKDKVLRHVSPAFAEDPLRVLRGFQFSARYGMSMNEQTAEFCKSLIPQASTLATERIRGEWEKFYLKGQEPGHGLAVLKQTGWDSTYPGLASINTSELQNSITKAAQISKKQKLTNDDKISVLSSTITSQMSDEDARNFVNSTVEGSTLQRQAYGLSRATGVSGNYSDGDVRRWSRSLSDLYTKPSLWAAREEAKNSSDNYAQLLADAQRLGVDNGPQPDLLQGRHVMERTSRRPGPWMGQLLKRAQAAQDEGEFTTLDDALAWLDSQNDIKE